MIASRSRASVRTVICSVVPSLRSPTPPQKSKLNVAKPHLPKYAAASRLPSSVPANPCDRITSGTGPGPSGTVSSP